MAGILEDLIPAIETKLTGSAFATALGDRFFFEQYQTADGSNPVTFPYAVYTVIADTSDFTFTWETADVLIQVSIYDKSESFASMADYITKLHALLDDGALTISNWTQIRIDREGHFVLSPDEDRVRHSASTFRIIAQKN